MPEFRAIKIVNRDQIKPEIEVVEVPWACLDCGGRRGEPNPYTWYEDGWTLTCDRWQNPCGHIESYVRVHDWVQRRDKAWVQKFCCEEMKRWANADRLFFMESDPDGEAREPSWSIVIGDDLETIDGSVDGMHFCPFCGDDLPPDAESPDGEF